MSVCHALCLCATPCVWLRTVTVYPQTPSGKIQKFALRDQYLSEQSANVG